MTGRLALLALASVLIGCGSHPSVQCGACPWGCDAASRCMPPPGDGGGCTSDTACPAPTPRCLTDEARCVTCLGDNDCTVGTCDLVAHACVPVPDSCVNLRMPIDLTPGTVLIHGNTARANDDTRLSCALQGSVGADVVYQLHIPRVGQLTAVVRADPSTSFRPVVALRSACATAGSEDGLGCSYALSTSRTATLVVDSLAPGEYFLWIDGETDEGGPFDVELRLADPQPVDTCVNPQPLMPSPDADAMGDTGPLHDDASGTCGGQGAPDAVYALQLGTPRRVRVEAIGTGFQPVVYLRSACADPSPTKQFACSAGAPGSASTVVELPHVEAGTSYVYVDGPSAGLSGRYRLRVSTMDPVPPPTNDVCSTVLALPVPPNALGQITAQGDTTGARQDSTGCGGTGPDLVYSLALPEAREVAVRVTPLAGSTYKPLIYLRKPGKCPSEQIADHVTCVEATQPGYPASFTVSKLTAGTYFLWVDGANATSGAFDLVVELSTPPPVPGNDTCSTATPLSLASGAVTVNGTTAGANDDSTSCEVLSNAPDVAYTVTLPQRQSLSIDVHAAAGSSLQPVVTLMPDAVCTAGPWLSCAYPPSPVPDRAAVVMPDVAAGTYLLWVDGDYGTSGPFSMRVSTGAVVHAPQNDGCGTILPALSPGQSLPGDTRGAVNDNYATCGLGCYEGLDAPDVAYSFAVTSSRSVTITVTPDATDGQLMIPVIYVQGPSAVCTDTATQQGLAVGTAYGAAVSLTLPNLPTGTYTLWVDGAGLSSGRFGVLLQ